jgi:hypothetical protein
MNIQGVGNQQAWMHVKAKQDDTKNITDIAEDIAAAETVQADDAQTEGDRAEGVLRLIQAGHFHGVADVRLRINFNDELQQISAQNTGQALEGGAQELSTNLTAELEKIGADFELPAETEALAASFRERMDQIIVDTKDGKTDLTTALASMHAEFATLLDALKAAMTGSSEPVEEEEAAEQADAEEAAPEDTDEAVVAEGETPEDSGVIEEEPLAPFETRLAELEDWFATAMTTLESSATATQASQALPPLSAPRGNGVAYAKFLEIYENMGSGTAQATNTLAAVPTVELDAQA